MVRVRTEVPCVVRSGVLHAAQQYEHTALIGSDKSKQVCG